MCPGRRRYSRARPACRLSSGVSWVPRAARERRRPGRPVGVALAAREARHEGPKLDLERSIRGDPRSSRTKLYYVDRRSRTVTPHTPHTPFLLGGLKRTRRYTPTTRTLWSERPHGLLARAPRLPYTARVICGDRTPCTRSRVTPTLLSVDGLHSLSAALSAALGLHALAQASAMASAMPKPSAAERPPFGCRLHCLCQCLCLRPCGRDGRLYGCAEGCLLAAK